MDNIDVDRHLFLNNLSSEFWFNTDRDMGTITGALSATDANNGNIFLDNLTVGGASNSAYILEDWFAGLLTCTSGDCINNYAYSGSIKPHGSYMVTEKPDNQPATFATWGYWEIAYSDPQDLTKQYHAHMPGTFG
jgi:hypothetical protein